MDPSTPGCRGLYIGYHVSYKVVHEDNFYTHLISLITYNLWNHSKCSVDNVYILTKKQSLQVWHSFSEVFTWLQNHTKSSHLFFLKNLTWELLIYKINKPTVTLVTDLFFLLTIHLFYGLKAYIHQILIMHLVHSCMLGKMSSTYFCWLYFCIWS